MKHAWTTRWLCAVGAMLCAGALHAAGLQVTDDRGVTVSLAQSPQRIVSLLPSLTETVCELGQCHRLVGVDRYSNHPASVRKLPQTGGGIDPNIEAIVALRPDVVLMAASSRGVQRLESLGLKVLMLERGAEHKHITDYKTATKMPWEFEHRGKTTQQQKEDYPVIHRGWAANERVMDAWANEKDSPYTEVKPFTWWRSYRRASPWPGPGSLCKSNSRRRRRPC